MFYLAVGLTLNECTFPEKRVDSNLEPEQTLRKTRPEKQAFF